MLKIKLSKKIGSKVKLQFRTVNKNVPPLQLVYLADQAPALAWPFKILLILQLAFQVGYPEI